MQAKNSRIVIGLAALIVVGSASADLNIGIGGGKYNTHDEFGPAQDGVNGTVDAIDNDDKTRTLRLGYRHRVTGWLDVEAAALHLGVLRQEMRGRMPSGAEDHRRTETSTVGLELTLQPRWKVFYLKTGITYYCARHRMQGTLGDDARTVCETTGALGGGVQVNRWRVEYTNYNHFYTRNSDLGGYYAREEYRNFHHVQAIRSF